MAQRSPAQDSTTAFSPDTLARRLVQGPGGSGYVIAYSGGGDSTALLHAMHEARGQLSAPIRAIHVHHDLHPDAGHWAAHCERVCSGLGIGMTVARASVEQRSAGGLEAAARRARYRCLGERLAEGEILLTAHTLDEQAETVLLRMLRGAGLEGLGGIPRLRRFAAGWLARPLLDVSRASLRDWLRSRDIEWLRDPDNLNRERSRVFLRREILPRLESHWPAARSVIARAADNLADAGAALSAYAAADTAAALAPAGTALRLAPLRALDPARRRVVLRRWLRERALPEPARGQLAQLESQALEARDDAGPVVSWPGAEVHRYRDALHAFAPRTQPDPGTALDWQTREPLALPAGLGELRLESAGDEPPDWRFTVRFRRGGERMRLPGREHHTELKNLFQDWGVPPWERGRIPLIYEADELVSVADMQPGRGLLERLEREGAVLRWMPACGG